jgi:hypothetical protein
VLGVWVVEKRDMLLGSMALLRICSCSVAVLVVARFWPVSLLLLLLAAPSILGTY